MFNNPFTAIFTGAVLGFVFLAPMQQLTNSLASQACATVRKDTHKLVHYSNFFGDVKSCIDKRYL